MRKIIVKSWAIGPNHDPYGAEEVTVRDGNKMAMFYQDGLGRLKLTLFTDDRIVRTVEGFDGLRGLELKMVILFRRHVGLDVRSAIDEYDRSYDPRCDRCPA